MKKEIRSNSGEIDFKIAQELFDEYKSYQSDSAFNYASIMHKSAEMSGDPSQQALTYAAFADYFISVGFFKEAAEMLNMIESQNVPEERLPYVYNINARLYRSLCSYVGGPESEIWSYYNDLNRSYLDSILLVAPKNSYEYSFAKIDREQLDHANPDKAIKDRKELLDRYHINDHEKAINYSLMAHSLIDAGQRAEAEYFLILSAIHDIRSNTTETTAANMLAMMLHEDGKNDLAYKYIQKALDDATFFNTRLRKYEISGYMPTIDRARVDWVSGQVWKLWIVISVIILLLVLTVILFLKLRIRKRVLEQTNSLLDSKTKELSKSYEALSQTNEQLKETLDQLNETTQIKDQYIMQSLYVNTSFVNQVEERCREAVKAIKEKKYDDLKFLPYNMGIKEERQRIFKSFDSAFLKLFPNFIDSFNLLFNEEDRIVLENDQKLPMEVRIFALMRLGISEPTEVAKYLNLSTKTVYVYKTKMKSRSNVGNNEFEARVKAIPKP
ncbi:MAG: hypothetical protein HDS62_08100 [Bacteroidales bacterium]|nr:hypothetical protein [Bacteroidales bacterium]